MTDEPEKFKTDDKPLSDEQVEEIGKIRRRDVNEAIRTASRGLRSLLNARVRRNR